MTINQLIDDTKKVAKRHGVKLRVVKGDFVQFGETKSNGFFDPETKLLAVAFNANFKDTFIHESCHMDQWIEDSQISAEYDSIVTTLLFDVLSGEAQYEGNEAAFAEQVRISRDLELDCERRSVAKIKQYNISDIDTSVYTKKANSYIFFYTYLLTTRKWYEIGKEPYSLEEVWRESPDHFDNDYSVIPENLKQAFDKYLN